MVGLIQDFGVIKHPKRKSESDFPRPGKKFPGIFLPLRFYKIVSYYTRLVD